MRKKLHYVALPFLLLLASAQDASAKSDTYTICLKNDTNQVKTILVEDVDNYDWDGVSRPDRNWNGAVVGPGETRCELAEVNYYAGKVHFSFVINGPSDLHKVSLETNEGRPKRFYVMVGSKPSDSILRGQLGQPVGRTAEWEVGEQCWSGCSRFTITDVP